MVEHKDDLSQVDLHLIILRRRTGYHENTVKNTLHFVVVDGEVKNYPSNFVCRFPDRIGGYWADSVFGRLFPNIKSELAKKLLTEALDKEKDPKIKLAIKKRLRNLN